MAKRTNNNSIVLKNIFRATMTFLLGFACINHHQNFEELFWEHDKVPLDGSYQQTPERRGAGAQEQCQGEVDTLGLEEGRVGVVKI